MFIELNRMINPVGGHFIVSKFGSFASFLKKLFCIEV